MQIRTKLMGTLKSQSPPGDRLELADSATIADALQTLAIPADHVHMVMVNSQLTRDLTGRLSEDDELTIMAPVGGG